MFVKRKAIVFYFEQRARIVLPDITSLRPRGSGERKFPQARRAMIVQREYKESHPRGAGIGTSCTKHRIPRFFTSVFPGLLARHKDSSAFRPARVPRFESRLSCSARHACRNSRSRPARGLSNRISKKQSPRGTRNKKQSSSAKQTSRFNLPILAHPGVSAPFPIPRNERSSPPRPSYPVGAGGVFP